MNVLDAAQWIVDNKDLTHQQMINITGQQIINHFPNKNMTGTYADNIAKIVRRFGFSIQARTRLQGLRDQLEGGGRTWLYDTLPDHEWGKGKRAGKPFIILWPEGAPASGGSV